MKKFYKENRLFSILMLIVLVCILIIIGMAGAYILKSNTKNLYGNRLDGIGDVKIDSKMKKDAEKQIEEMEKVSSALINVHGKIIYFDIEFEDDASRDDAVNTAIKCLSLFEENYLNYYDIQFLTYNKKFKTESVSESSEEEANIFPILGYRKAGATNISWSRG